MRAFSIVSAILPYVPQVLDLVERFFSGKGRGPEKRIAASKEILEVIVEGVQRGNFDGYGDTSFADVDALTRAIQDEKAFIEKIADVNDAVVALMNYIASFKGPSAAERGLDSVGGPDPSLN